MFRTLSRFILRDLSILNYTDFLHQWYNYTLVYFAVSCSPYDEVSVYTLSESPVAIPTSALRHYCYHYITIIYTYHVPSNFRLTIYHIHHIM